MVGIVILDYNNPQDTINCIESVKEYTKSGTYKLFIVENGSTCSTVYEISEYVSSVYGDKNAILHDGESLGEYPYITLYISNTNDGYAKGNNKALQLIDKDKDIDNVLILNNDILFVEDIVSPLVNYVNHLPDCGIVSAMLLKKDMHTIDVNCARRDYKKMQFFWEYLLSFKNYFGVLGKYERYQKLLIYDPELVNMEYFEIEMPSGSCMLLKKEIFREAGYFDPHTFLYFEENILYRKMQSLGLKNYIVPNIKCVHIGAATTSKQKTSYFTQKCHMESNAYYLKEYCNAPILSIYVRVMSQLTLLKIRIKSMFRKSKIIPF